MRLRLGRVCVEIVTCRCTFGARGGRVTRRIRARRGAQKRRDSNQNYPKTGKNGYIAARQCLSPANFAGFQRRVAA